ncbi:MAG TPA: transglutaminase family protein, partial [Candidatus Lustribacter sp.]|nr:transglutaminase family protein [Candidatus Lustribacter sp.]
YGQGKWYPGESLPRWAFSLIWRGDGLPLWHDANRIARETADGEPTNETAAALAQGIAQRLNLDPSFVAPAYEDVRTLVLKEAELPENVTTLDSKLDDPEERARLARSFKRGLNTPAAYVLPVQRWNAVDVRRWRSERWTTRAGQVHLVPGDSPAGLRLPLASLPYLDEGNRPVIAPRDPFAALEPLPDDPYAPAQQFISGGAHDPRQRQAFVEQGIAIDGSVRTAISVEPRDGRLCVFMPPTETAGDYLELLSAVEQSAAGLATPVHVEGYLPPFDPRINVIKVTPDPGVIEVNVHPATSWREAVAITTTLYDEARQARLATEKFQLDGKHTGTGGGNHIVLGAATPADSPFLRRPDLLRSVVAFWQNHPSLSYLFSGLFIGPTSQAPRIDEARLDSLYELELAFAEVPPRSTARVSPWLVDRIFRNLLIDVTGSTHRTEICIDKLYSPDGPTGRLGLVEFRSFEMPPHAEMSLAQQLLIRALVARFWDEPYSNGLVRWGTALHDRFMLPHFVWSDFLDVLRDLGAHGFAFDPAWFRPHWEFRFPLYGAVQYGGVKLELRGALEPWNVMGEEGAPGGTVRYVDGSLERLEVTVSGLTAGRHHVLVNGRRVPLTATSIDAAVGGVRYRAWRAPHALHPTIAPNVPLVCEIWDEVLSRSLGGCTYHVAHPGGRNYTTFPVNAYEAEGRRLARFEPFGFTAGVFVPPPAAPNPDFPHTLDLRRR